jgi:pimeloyl-ACP methyl ester carboxylesterase
MNAHDVRAVVQGLGYDAYNIYGISYGTRLALEVMRTDPTGVRSVTLDSVAPTTVRLYDELLGPHQDMLDAIVSQCADDPGCATAYPNFGEQINQVVADLRANPIPGGRGTVEVTAELYMPLLQGRNLAGLFGDVTEYLPRITAELSERKTTALDRYVALAEEDRISAMRRIFRARVDLDPDEQALAIAAFQAADLMDAAEELATTALTQLESDLRAAPNIAAEFSAGLEAAYDGMPGDGARTAMLSSLLALQDGPQTRERLLQLIADHVLPATQPRLSNLVNAMTEEELSEAYARIIERDELLAGAFLTYFQQMTYACQEDIPWNSREGAAVVNETIRYPFLLEPTNLRAIETIYAACDAFDQHLPRPDFHEPVTSNLPVMVLSGLADTQTSWRWGPEAAETLPNAQTFVFPGAGHGVFQFSACARDMTVAFIHAPDHPVPDGCIASLEPNFFLPDEPMR